VVAELSPSGGVRTVVIHAHHDAARTGLVFHRTLAKSPRSTGWAVARAGWSHTGAMWGALRGQQRWRRGTSRDAASSSALAGGEVLDLLAAERPTTISWRPLKALRRRRVRGTGVGAGHRSRSLFCA
jgi:hypothetical protein